MAGCVVSAAAQPCAFERHPGAAAAPLPPEYRPRRPEGGVLYRVVHDHLETMLAEARERTEHGFGYPRFIEREFRRYLDCAQPQRGFARVRCSACGFERLLAFSCKTRLCPSCHARRMHQSALNLTDHLLPFVPYRLWTFTLPRTVRYAMAREPVILSAVLRAFVHRVFAWQRRAARADGGDHPLPAAVVWVQFFGGALNANVHFHALLPDGLFLAPPAQPLCFLEQAAPRQEDLERLLRRIAARVLRLLARQQDAGAEAHPDDDLRAQMLAHAVQAHLPGPALTDDHTGAPPAAAPQGCASAEGFSLHANVTVPAHDRQALLRVIRYAARQPFALERLELGPDGMVRYHLRRPWGPAAVTHVALAPTAFLHRLAALLPRPYQNLTRYFGLFAAHARRRHELAAYAGAAPTSPGRARHALGAAVELLPPAAPRAAGGAAITRYTLVAAPGAHGLAAGHPPCDQPAPAPAAASAPASVATPAAASPAGASPPAGAPPPDTAADATPDRPRRRSWIPWSELLKRTFAEDLLRCPRCLTGTLLIIAFITDPAVVEQILTHLGLPSDLPVPAPARRPAQLEWDDQAWGGSSHPGDGRRHARRAARDPPFEDPTA